MQRARDAGVSALAPMLHQVSTLSLRHNQLSDVGACALSAHSSKLSAVRLGGNMIGARGVGEEVLLSINRLDIARGFEAGMAVVALAIVIDRLTQAAAARWRVEPTRLE